MRAMMIAGVLVALALPAGAHAEADCADLKAVKLPHAEVTSATLERLKAGEACRVTVTSRPTADSDIRIEVWIPVGAAWNGKFVQLGNGGFAGSIASGRLKMLAVLAVCAALLALAADLADLDPAAVDLPAHALVGQHARAEFGHDLAVHGQLARALHAVVLGEPPADGVRSGGQWRRAADLVALHREVVVEAGAAVLDEHRVATPAVAVGVERALAPTVGDGDVRGDGVAGVLQLR